MNNPGFNYLTALSLSVIDRCNAEEAQKRAMLYSMYSFASLYEEELILKPDGILVKHGICFTAEWEGGEIAKDCVLIEEDGKKLLRYDVGGETYKRLRGDEPPPTKLGLYEMALKIITCSAATDELRTMWFIYLPFIPLTGAPLDRDSYTQLKKELLNEKVYADALASRYSDMIYDSAKEMVLGGVDPVVTDWYIEYVEWKNVKTEKGVSREVEKYQKFLARGDFEYVLKGTEKLLNTFPTDREIILLNVASRVSLGKRNKKLLEDALLLIDEALRRGSAKKEYFLYYKGLCKLGLGLVDEATELFTALDKDYHFELATFMLNAMAKYKGEKI